MKIEKILKELEKLDENTIQYIVLNLMKNKKLDYTDFSEVYVNYLKDKDKSKRMNIQGLSFMLSQYWKNLELPEEHKKFTEQKAAYHMLKSKTFKTSKFEEELKDFLSKNPYEEDENGFKINS